jgi:D-alanyl-D-alanine carboxypeptidase
MGERVMRAKRSGRAAVDLALAGALLLTAAWAFAPHHGLPEPGAAVAAPAPRPCGDSTPLTFGAMPSLATIARPTLAPPVSAASAAVIDAASGRVLYGKRMHEHRAPASITKMMTALLAVEAISDQNATVTSSTDASAMIGSSVMGLWPTAEVTLRDLLYGLMLPSGNDAAVELARDLSGTESAFVDVMNQRAQIMGMNDTHFANPHGLDDSNHYSSAYDMAVLARYAMQNPEFRQIVGTREYYLSSPFDYEVHNGNSLLSEYPGADGVKIGWTEAAGWTFVASAQRDGREVIVSVMNSADRDADAAALLDWAFASPYWNGSVWSPPSAPRLLGHPAIKPQALVSSRCETAASPR